MQLLEVPSIDVVKILGYGLSGFAFLLMFFAFLLLRQVIGRDNSVSKMIYKSIWAFMALSFIMTITIGIFSFFVNDYKNNVIARNESAVTQLLKADSLQNQVSAIITTSNHEKIAEAKEQQQVIVKQLDSTVQNSAVSEEDKKDFTIKKDRFIKVTDMLASKDIAPAKKDSLKIEYVKISRDISALNSKAVKTVLDMKKKN